jgi:hypothetical protein
MCFLRLCGEILRSLSVVDYEKQDRKSIEIQDVHEGCEFLLLLTFNINIIQLQVHTYQWLLCGQLKNYLAREIC